MYTMNRERRIMKWSLPTSSEAIQAYSLTSFNASKFVKPVQYSNITPESRNSPLLDNGSLRN
jgi:hypothetical protein